MKLVVPVPPDWEHRVVEDGILFQAPSEIFGMLVTPMGPAPVDPETWVQQAFMHRAREEEGPPRNLRISRFTTVDGWSGLLLDGALGTQDRFVAYLAFQDYAATVIAMCRDAEAQPTWRDQVLELVVRSQPDFSEDQVVSLSDLLGASPPAVIESRKHRPLVGWHRSFVGGDLVLTGDGGPQAGTIRVTSHMMPIRSVREIFGAFLAPAPGVTVVPPVTETTDEGEHAAIATASTPEFEHTLAVVFGDDHYTRIDSVVRDPAQAAKFAATTRELMLSTTLGLGAGRWRRFYYEPPPGWIGVVRPRGTLWIAPECGRYHQVMRVFDARPPADHELLHGTRMFETLPLEFYREPPKGPVSYWTANDLECLVSVYRAKLPNRTSMMAVLDGTIITEHYTYPIRMECDTAWFEETMQLFERVVASFRPVPERRKVELNVSTAVEFWAD